MCSHFSKESKLLYLIVKVLHISCQVDYYFRQFTSCWVSQKSLSGFKYPYGKILLLLEKVVFILNQLHTEFYSHILLFYMVSIKSCDVVNFFFVFLHFIQSSASLSSIACSIHKMTKILKNQVQ